jgi:hypothetical protein
MMPLLPHSADGRDDPAHGGMEQSPMMWRSIAALLTLVVIGASRCAHERAQPVAARRDSVLGCSTIDVQPHILGAAA